SKTTGRITASRPQRLSASVMTRINKETGRVPTTARHFPARRILSWAVAAAFGAVAMPAMAAPQAAELPAHAPARQQAGFTPCELGRFDCPPRPVSFALCRPNALLAFYQPGLPEDSRGRENAVTNVFAEHVDASNRSLYRLS